MKHWRKGLKRITAAALTVMMIGTTVDASALTVLAEEATEVTCNHVCDEACGGTETASRSALTGCTHVHDGICGYNADGYSYNAETNTYEVYTADAMQTAIDAAEVSGTTESPAIIKLMADLDLPGVASDPNYPEIKDYGVLIAAGVITIDLNGYTLNCVDGADILQIGAVWGEICDAKVTITDSSDDGTGVISSVNGYAISNLGGELVINKGTIKVIEAEASNGLYLYGIGNQEGTVIINDGKISVLIEGQDVFAKAVKSNGSNAAVIMKGGMISAVGYNCDGIEIMAGTCTITGGTITADGLALDISADVEISITGGIFEGGRSDIEAASGVIQVLGVDKNGGKGATFPDGITVENNTLKNILAEGAGFYDAGGNLLAVADDAISINETVTVGCAGHTGGTATCEKKAVCTTCGREYGELDADNHGEMNPVTGKCDGCGNFVAAASVTIGEGTTYYTDFANALENWADGTTLTLLNDATYGTTDDDILYILNKSVTLDLNGHTLNLSGNHTTIQVGEYENAAGTLTILDSGVNGTLKSVGNSVVVYDNCNIQGGNLIGRVYVMTTATLNMTGGSITTDDTTLSYEAVWNDGKFHISGGTLTAKSRGIANVGTLTITGSPTIIDNGGAAVWNAEQGNVTISGTPTFSSSSYELYIRQKMTLNTQPADGTTWKVYVDTGYITNGVFAIPGEGVTLDASKFTSAMDGYDVGWNAKGELLLCNHTEQVAVSNGNGTHNTTCYCGKTTYETNVACSGGVATDTSQAYCDYCNAPYGELNPDVHYDIVAANMTAEQLQSALTELLNAGETDILIVLAANADEEMFNAINTALRSSTAADGSINLTIGGVKTIPSYAFGNGHPEESQNTDPYELKTLTLPDAVTLKKNAIVAPKLEAVYAPKVTEWKVWAVWNNYEAMNTIILSAPGTITANFTGLNTENIDLVLNCDKKNDVTDGTTWQGETWKSITFVHSWMNGTCTVCGATCDHSGSTHERATDNGDGTHSFTCSVCGSVGTENHDFSYNANNNVITASCEVCETTFGTATVTAGNATYDGTAHEATVTKTGTLANAELVIAYYEDGILLGAAPVNAGTYTAKISYNEKTASIDYTIAKAESAVATAPTVKTGLTYTGSAQKLVTGGATTCGTMQYSLAENGTYSETIPTGTDAGEYTVWYKVAGDANHNDTAPASVVVTIAPKSLEGAEVVFGNCYYSGDSLHSPQTTIISIKVDGIALSSDDYTMEEYEKQNAGTYDVDITGKGNYTGTITAKWSISKNDFTSVSRIMLMIDEEPNNVSVLTKNYDGNGEFDTSNAIYISGDNEEEGQAIALHKGFSIIVRTADVALGEGKSLVADITILGDMQQNFNQSEYKDIPVKGITGTITKADATVATAPVAKDLTYTGSAQELVTDGTTTCGTMQYSLEENGTYSETIPTGEDAGSYTVWYKVVGDANHNDTVPASVVVTIAPKEINVTARPASKTYGDPDPAIDYVVTGLEGNDALFGTLAREAGETAGTYAITQGTLTNENNPNYNISFVEGTFTINKAAAPAITEPTATAITYGQKLSASILDGNGWLWVNGDTVPGTSGSYDAYIEVDDSNYDYTGVSGYDADTHRVVREATVTVNKATLTITAKSYTIKVGGTLPAYEYEVTGLVNGDALPVEVTASCSAADSNTAGTYDITVSGALSTDCYTITYVNGTLTISEKDTQEITASDVTLTYGEAGKKISATTNGGGAVSYTVATGTDVISVAADGTITVLKAGTATVTIRAAETADYAAAAKTISVTVNKAENAPNMPSGTMNVAYDVENVGAVTLPDGWAWKAEDASKALTAGTAVTATAVYSGVDKGNYETETVEVVITRSNCSHTFTSEVTKQPTVDAVGERTYTCSTCGYSYTEEIEKLEPTVTPVPTATPTATPRPTVAPTSAPTATPSVTPTPVPGTTTVPSSGETVVDENGDEVTSVVQEPGTTTKLSIPELTDGTPEEGEEAELVTWESSNPDVAEVDEDGNVTMKKPGLTEIVVTVGEGEDARRETIVVLVEEPRTYVNPLEEAFKDVRLGTSWNDIPLIRYQKVGETVDINFYGVKNWKQSNYEYIWQTSDESVAVVDGKGRVTALKPGVVELTLGLKNKADGHFLNVQSVEIVIPGDYENKILLGTSRNNTFDSIVLNLNERIDINFYGVKNWKKEDYEYYWSSSEPSVVWVDNLGRLVPVNPGKAEVFLVLIEKKNKAPRYVVPMEVTVPKK